MKPDFQKHQNATLYFTWRNLSTIRQGVQTMKSGWHIWRREQLSCCCCHSVRPVPQAMAYKNLTCFGLWAHGKQLSILLACKTNKRVCNTALAFPRFCLDFQAHVHLILLSFPLLWVSLMFLEQHQYFVSQRVFSVWRFGTPRYFWWNVG